VRGHILVHEEVACQDTITLHRYCEVPIRDGGEVRTFIRAQVLAQFVIGGGPHSSTASDGYGIRCTRNFLKLGDNKVAFIVLVSSADCCVEPFSLGWRDLATGALHSHAQCTRSLVAYVYRHPAGMLRDLKYLTMDKTRFRRFTASVLTRKRGSARHDQPTECTGARQSADRRHTSRTAYAICEIRRDFTARSSSS